MRENRTSGSEGGEAQTNELSLPPIFLLPVRDQRGSLLLPLTRSGNLIRSGSGNGAGQIVVPESPHHRGAPR